MMSSSLAILLMVTSSTTTAAQGFSVYIECNLCEGKSLDADRTGDKGTGDEGLEKCAEVCRQTTGCEFFSFFDGYCIRHSKCTPRRGGEYGDPEYRELSIAYKTPDHRYTSYRLEETAATTAAAYNFCKLAVQVDHWWTTTTAATLKAAEHAACAKCRATPTECSDAKAAFQAAKDAEKAAKSAKEEVCKKKPKNRQDCQRAKDVMAAELTSQHVETPTTKSFTGKCQNEEAYAGVTKADQTREECLQMLYDAPTARGVSYDKQGKTCRVLYDEDRVGPIKKGSGDHNFECSKRHNWAMTAPSGGRLRRLRGNVV